MLTFLFRFVVLLASLNIEWLNARKLPDIYWNSTNPIFDISNTDHVKQVRLLDKITIICPRPGTADNDYEYSKLYVVSREEYETCELNSSRLLGICATPDRQSSISVVFRDFSPLPSGFEFHPGQSYYVIATSNGSRNGLNNTFGGLCLLSNMRLKFDVLKTEDVIESTAPVTSVPAKARSLGGHRNATDRRPDLTRTPAVDKNEPSQQPITYIIHTVEPEHFTVAHSLQANAPDSACPSSAQTQLLVAAFSLLYLINLN